MTMAFDTLKFAHRLEQVGVPRNQAEAHAELARDMIIADLATKGDLAMAVKDLQAAIKDVRPDLGKLEGKIRAELKLLDHRMTIRLGPMLAAASGIIVVLQKLL